MQKRDIIFPALPEFLSRIPKKVIREVDVTDALWTELCSRENQNALGSYIAFSNILSTLNAAKVQQRRIIRAKKALFKLGKKKLSDSTLFNDVHFYLICWARITKLAYFVARATGYRRLKFVLKRYRLQLESMSRFRDHLEHFEERLPGGSKHHILKAPGDLYNIGGEFASIGGEKINIGTESLRLLNTIVEALKTAVLYDALEAMVGNDSSRLSHLLHRATMNVEVAHLIRQYQKNILTPPNQALKLTE
jgi:hypothetical protein